MIIDFHTHIFPEKIAYSTIKKLEENSNGKAYTDGTYQGMISALKRANADIAVALPVMTKPTQFDSIFNFALSVNAIKEEGKERVISFAGIHPACDNIRDKMKLIKDSGLMGVKIHPDYQSTFIDDDGYIEILKCAKDYDLIVVTHSGIDDGYVGEPVKCPPELALKVINKVDHNKFVLGHYGAHKQWGEVLDLLAGKNVYFDTAFTFHEIEEDFFKKILDKHGEDRVLFATDCPWRDIVDDVKILKSYNLKNETYDKLFYKNALKLLKMEGEYGL
ncbi:MAG: amidohydrolase family protein [Clostridia bacterium]|nr:amidohydrolase family protein [Clostridia bacterium]